MNARSRTGTTHWITRMTMSGEKSRPKVFHGGRS